MAEVGRPQEWGDDIVRKLEEVFALDGTISEACFYAGISRDMYYRYVKEDAEKGSKERELYDRFQALRERPILKARQTIVKGLDEPENARWYLERKRKAEFSSRTELAGAGDGAVPIKIIYEKPDNNIQALN